MDKNSFENNIDWGCHGELDWIDAPSDYDVIKYIKKLQEENEKLKEDYKELDDKYEDLLKSSFQTESDEEEINECGTCGQTFDKDGNIDDGGMGCKKCCPSDED
jgi:protein-arginine kinase activator protein McsA